MSAYELDKEIAKFFEDLKVPEKYSVVSREFTRNQITSIDKFLLQNKQRFRLASLKGNSYMNEEKYYGANKMFQKSLIPKKFDVNEFKIYLEKLKKEENRKEYERKNRKKTQISLKTKINLELKSKVKEILKTNRVVKTYEPNYNFIKRRIPAYTFALRPFEERELIEPIPNDFDQEFKNTKYSTFYNSNSFGSTNYQEGFYNPKDLKLEKNNSTAHLSNIGKEKRSRETKLQNANKLFRRSLTNKDKDVDPLTGNTNLITQSKTLNRKTTLQLDNSNSKPKNKNIDNNTTKKTNNKFKTLNKIFNKCDSAPVIPVIDAITFKKGGCAVDFSKTTKRENSCFSTGKKNKFNDQENSGSPGVGTYNPNYNSIDSQIKTFSFQGQDIPEFYRKKYLIQKVISGNSNIGLEYKILQIINQDLPS